MDIVFMVRQWRRKHSMYLVISLPLKHFFLVSFLFFLLFSITVNLCGFTYSTYTFAFLCIAMFAHFQPSLSFIQRESSVI